MPTISFSRDGEFWAAAICLSALNCSITLVILYFAHSYSSMISYCFAYIILYIIRKKFPYFVSTTCLPIDPKIEIVKT